MSYAQPNCNVYLWAGDTLKYESCQQVLKAGKKHYQFKKEFHQALDSALHTFPEFAYAYREKAAPYVKSGHFIKWKRLIDKAVYYDRAGYLSVRASLRYKFFADYEGAIKDIDSFEAENDYDIGYTSNGTYHLNMVKALCHKARGNNKEAIAIMERQIKASEKENFVGAYDYLHLGVLYLENGEYNKALATFEKQKKESNLAENEYYAAIAFKNIEQYANAKESITRSLNLFLKGIRMFDPYNILFDQIDLAPIKREVSLLEDL